MSNSPDDAAFLPTGAPRSPKKNRPAYGLVLLLVFATYVATMITDNRGWGSLIVIGLQSATLVITLYTSRVKRFWRMIGVMFALLSLILPSIATILHLGDGSDKARSVANGLLFYITPLAILANVARQRVITWQTILGALAVYLLIGMAFGYIYAAADRIATQQLFTGITRGTSSDYQFFSFTTLTTTGYGNIVPITALGRTLATTEALFGQIFLVIVVARLVSLWQNPRVTQA